MKTLLSFLVLFAACVAPAPLPVEFGGPGAPVPAGEVRTAADMVEMCLGTSCDLDGWDFAFAAEEDATGRFACPQATSCGARPPGCKSDAQCPCRCKGLTLFEDNLVIVTSDLSALKHEIIHVCTGDVDHIGPEWTCQ